MHVGARAHSMRVGARAHGMRVGARAHTAAFTRILAKVRERRASGQRPCLGEVRFRLGARPRPVTTCRRCFLLQPAACVPRLLSSSTRGIPPRWSPAQPSPLRPGWPTLTRAPEPPRGHPPRAFRSSRRPLPLLSASQSRFPRRSVFHSAGPGRVSGIYEGFTEGLEPVQRRRVAATPPVLPTSPASGLTFLLHVLSEAELGSTAQRRRIGKDAAGGVKRLRADHPCYARRC